MVESKQSFMSKSEKVISLIFLLLAFGLLILVYISPTAQASLPAERQLDRKELAKLDTIFRTEHYVGPPKHLSRQRVKKLRKLTKFDINAIDSLTLIKIPGIGPAYAHRILNYREYLGGFYDVYQLQEVYGMTPEKFISLKPWFKFQTKPKQYPLKNLKAGEIPRHPYLSWEQTKVLNKYINQKGQVRKWSELMHSSHFSRDDSIRLSNYFIE